MKTLGINNFLKYYIAYIVPLVLVSGILSYTVFRQDIRSFHAVMQNNEKQVLDFQKNMIKDHLSPLEEDIKYLENLQRSRQYVNSGFSPENDLTNIYSSFLKRRKIYSSIRIIDSGGFERFRMDYDGTAVTKIPDKDLQSKGDRYYFNEIMNTAAEDVYFSRMDFNYENGKLQLPHEPILRVAKLFLDESGSKRAFIILNYKGKDILDLMERISIYSFGKTFLRNYMGWIVSISETMSNEETHTLEFLNTEEGKIFINDSEGQRSTINGFITFKKISISESPTSPEWELISFVYISKIKAQTEDAFRRGIIIFVSLSLVSMIVSFFAVKNKTNRIKANLIIEERARIFDLNPAPVIKTSARGEILSSNIAAKTILGLTTTPPSIYNVFNKLSRQEINNINSDNINNFEYQIGQKTYFFTSIRELSSGQVFFYGTDITENFIIREELANFKIAVKQSANVIVFTDLEGRILFANDAFETVTGYSSKEVLGQKPTVLNSGYHSSSFYKELWDTIKSGKVWSGEFYNKRKDGSFFWEKATISPVLDNNGNPRFFIAVKEDITEKKETEAELKTQTQYAESARISAEKARIDAESANLLKSTFLANMSHEIRTPMNAILGFTRLLLEKEMLDEDKEMLEIIMNSGESLLSLINDILDFSKIEANEIDLSSVKVNLPYFFESIEDLFHIQIKQKKLKFNLSLSKGLPDIIYGDENRIRQVLINIIGNAIKFTDKGSIKVAVVWNDNALGIRVSDTGIGIAQDKLQEIFSPFKQSDSSMDRKYEGTGLGLAISIKLTKLMGGTVSVESQEGKGSTFIINIPLEECKETNQLSKENRLEEKNKNKSKAIVEGWLNKAMGDDILLSIIKDAIVSLPRHLKRLESEIINKNTEGLQAVSHELMGSTGNLGMTEVYELLKEINTGIKKNGIDITKIENIYKQLVVIIEGIPLEYTMEQASELLPIEGDTIDINILTADDSAVNRQLIGAMLSSIYVDSDFAEDGIEVLEKLDNKKYDILLLDIQMPKMDGMETIKNIRNNIKYDDLHVIAVTANAMRGDARKYLDSGCDDYISKPIEKDIFLKKIEYQIQKISKSAINTITIPDDAEFENIISLLEKEEKIFNPGRVKNIASKLEAYSSGKQINSLIKKLIESANSFDSKGLNSIICELREMNKNGN